MSATLVAATLPVILILAPAIERISQQHQWSPLQVIAAKDSIYGRITITDAGGMRSIYEDGSILANAPDKAAAEETVHYALLEHPAPRRVLLLGSSATGSIAEALQYPTIEQVDVVELDPALTSMFRMLSSRESEKMFSDARVHSHFGDGRQYLRASRAKFDVVLVNVPDPETAQWNRFYTVEFFALARQRLAAGGIVALQLRSSEEFISAERAEFLRCIRATLGQVFPHVAVIPGDPIHMFAAAGANTLTEDPQVLVARLRGRRVQTQYVSEYLVPFRMSAERLAYTSEALRPVASTSINRDFHPVAYYFNEMLWSSQFRGGYGTVLRRLARISPASVFGWVAAALVVFGLVAFNFGLRQSRPRAAAGFSVCTGGYCLMTLQILLLLTFQSVYGYLYYEIAMLIGMFMAGIALGSWLGLQRASKGHLARLAATNQLMLAACAPVLMVLATLLARAPEASAGKPMAAMGFPVIAFLCGIPGGLQFTVASKLYAGSTRHENGAGRSTGSGAGLLYSLDLLGGCVGALLITGFLVPVYGLWNTAWLAALGSLLPALLLLRVGATSRPRLDAPQTLRQ
jgi:spermidine synthase